MDKAFILLAKYLRHIFTVCVNRLSTDFAEDGLLRSLKHLIVSSTCFQQMTLEEYEKVLEEKRKALEAFKVKERKVDLDKEFESMQLACLEEG